MNLAQLKQAAEAANDPLSGLEEYRAFILAFDPQVILELIGAVEAFNLPTEIVAWMHMGKPYPSKQWESDRPLVYAAITPERRKG